MNSARTVHGHFSTCGNVVSSGESEDTVQPLIHELQELVRAFIDGGAQVRDLRRWLGFHAGEVAASHSAELDDLYGEVACLVSEYDLGDRSLSDLRVELAPLCGPSVAMRRLTLGWSIEMPNSGASTDRAAVRWKADFPTAVDVVEFPRFVTVDMPQPELHA